MNRLHDAMEDMFADRVARVRQIGREPQLLVSDHLGWNVARRPWILAMRFEQNEEMGLVSRRGMGLWAADTEAEILARKRLVEERPGLGSFPGRSGDGSADEDSC